MQDGTNMNHLICMCSHWVGYPVYTELSPGASSAHDNNCRTSPVPVPIPLLICLLALVQDDS